MESGNRSAQTPWRWLRAFASGIVVGVKKNEETARHAQMAELSLAGNIAKPYPRGRTHGVERKRGGERTIVKLCVAIGKARAWTARTIAADRRAMMP
jgi:hypothetical protein